MEEPRCLIHNFSKNIKTKWGV